MAFIVFDGLFGDLEKDVLGGFNALCRARMLHKITRPGTHERAALSAELTEMGSMSSMRRPPLNSFRHAKDETDKEVRTIDEDTFSYTSINASIYITDGGARSGLCRSYTHRGPEESKYWEKHFQDGRVHHSLWGTDNKEITLPADSQHRW